MRRAAIFLLFAQGLLSAPCFSAEFTSDWDRQPNRVWIGPQYWANPIEDWRIQNGRLECTSSGKRRSVHLLTHRLGEQDGTLEMSVIVGLQQSSHMQQGSDQDQSRDRQEGRSPYDSVGFEIGIQSELGDYRSSLLRGNGIPIAFFTDGWKRLGGEGSTISVSPDLVDWLKSPEGIRIRVSAAPHKDERYSLRLNFENPAADGKRGQVSYPSYVTYVAKSALVGNIALTVNRTPKLENDRNGLRGDHKFWFRDLKISGTKLVENPEQTFGPILYAMHTLSRGVMTMTVQMPPIGEDEDQTVELQVPLDVARQLLRVPGVQATSPADDADSPAWTTIARATIDPLSRTARFRIPHWPDTQDVPYRLAYTMRTTDGEATDHDYIGTVRKDPVDKPVIAVAGFTGHEDTAFPNEKLVSNVLKQDPDLCLFTGDQIYERNGGFGIIRNDVERGTLNYLRKIYLWGWSFRDVLRDRPALVLPDDHDVYQGNVWGEGGKPTKHGMKDHAAGGFAEPADFLNVVFRTQVGHHPPVFDATPMMQGINCWYGDCVYGRISFALLEDRYFKSGPEGKVNDWPGRPDHVKDPNYDTATLDQPGLVLLGRRQLDFLDHWAADWRGAEMKCVCSQTIFANVANYHGAKQEFIYADLDSNGWPQTGRDKAVAAMRRGFAFHYAGDQHLPSIIQYGIDDWRDAGFSFCVPSTAAGYPRSWRPDAEGRAVRNRPAAGLPNTGDYYDSLKNLVTVYAVGNPAKENRKPLLEHLHDKSSGHGMVRFDKDARTITMECWKLLFDADDPQADDQFPGWPKTIGMLENDGRAAAASLPTIEVSGTTDPVVQVINEASGEVVYTLRIKGRTFRPKVFEAGTYTVRVGDQNLTGIEITTDENATIDVAF